MLTPGLYIYVFHFAVGCGPDCVLFTFSMYINHRPYRIKAGTDNCSNSGTTRILRRGKQISARYIGLVKTELTVTNRSKMKSTASYRLIARPPPSNPVSFHFLCDRNETKTDSIFTPGARHVVSGSSGGYLIFPAKEKF